MKLSRLKRTMFALVAITGSFALILSGLLALDLYAHTKVERSAGLNRHGYRGTVVGRKPAGTVRAVMLGGSTVYGFNLEVEDALPPQLERELAKVEPGVQIVNLGYHQEGAVSFVPTLKSYEYLDYDIVLLYEGYNDILGDGQANFDQKRHASPVFRAVGYFPILPLVLREKASFMRQGTPGAVPPPGGKAVFAPSVADRTSATALDATSTFAAALERTLDRISDPVQAGVHTGSGCGTPWSHYCAAVGAAVRHAIDRGKRVLVIGQPRLARTEAARHASQQQALRDMLAHDFAGDARVKYVDLWDAVDLAEGSMDGLHLTREENTVVAMRLVEPLRELVQQHRLSRQ